MSITHASVIDTPEGVVVLQRRVSLVGKVLTVVLALGQGFNGGLAPLATHFGVDVTDDPDSGLEQQTNPPPAPQPTHGSTAPTPRAAPTIKLSKITLQKSEPVDLSKQSGKFGKITVNLNWKQAPAGLAGLLKGGIDLDLGIGVIEEGGQGGKEDRGLQ